MNVTIGKEDFEKLRELEESLWRPETRFDREYMEGILSPGFFEVGRSGRVHGREDTLSAPRQDIIARFPLKDFKVHFINENAVLVTYISEVTYNEVQVGNRSSIWVRTAGKWQLRFHQGTPVPR